MKKYEFVYKTVSRKLHGDLHTPVSIYLKLRDKFPQSALLESSDYHGEENSKSFIAINPIGHVSIEHGDAIFHFPNGEKMQKKLTNAFKVENAINEFLQSFEIVGDEAQLVGLYGFTSFNAVRYFEEIPVKDERQKENDAPDMIYTLFKNVIIFNHFNNEINLIEIVKENEADNLAELEDEINFKRYKTYEFRAVGECESTISDEQHKANIRRGIGHCKRGDVFQIVLSRRFVQRYEGDDFQLYRALRTINNSPYLFYFDFGGFRIFGSSPETHCKIVGNRAYIDPIAGTTKRTGDEKQDKINAEFLKNDPKENAEHVMLVDLARNDLSRNCKNVYVKFFKDMQYYSHVIHLVSRVEGTLCENADKIKSFIDTFPAGTLSGAPKVKAMQLISEIEPHNRGAYGGCIGFIGFSGDVNQAITIRTFVSRNNELWLQAGGGIVAKSDENYELQEVNNKLGALMNAIKIAQNF